MLTSGGRPGDLSRCRQLGIGAYLTKPVTPSDLLEGVTALLQALPEKETPASPESAPRGRQLRVLLAEDNSVNQTLMVARLEKQGHSVVVAGTGAEAVRAWESEPFDLVLMDIQMPEMDGFEATRLMRKLEQGRHTPIVALTAHAMKGDRERCLAAGMDGYLGKPVRTEELFRLLVDLTSGRLIAGASGHGSGQGPGQGSGESLLFPEYSPPVDGDGNGHGDGNGDGDGEETLDREEMDRRVGGDQELLRELIVLFAGECPRLLGEIDTGLTAGDLPRVHRAAHSLKGMIATVGGKSAYAEAYRLEELARAGEACEARAAYPPLEQAARQLQAALGELLTE
jgi:CheY-like chemotaxis protein